MIMTLQGRFWVKKVKICFSKTNIAINILEKGVNSLHVMECRGVRRCFRSEPSRGLELIVNNCKG